MKLDLLDDFPKGEEGTLHSFSPFPSVAENPSYATVSKIALVLYTVVRRCCDFGADYKTSRLNSTQLQFGGKTAELATLAAAAAAVTSYPRVVIIIAVAYDVT